MVKDGVLPDAVTARGDVIGARLVISIETDDDESVAVAGPWYIEMPPAALLHHHRRDERGRCRRARRCRDCGQRRLVLRHGIVGAWQLRHACIAEHRFDASRERRVDHAVDVPDDLAALAVVVERHHRHWRAPIVPGRFAVIVQKVVLQGLHGAGRATTESAIDARAEIPQRPQVALQRADQRGVVGETRRERQSRLLVWHGHRAPLSGRRSCHATKYTGAPGTTTQYCAQTGLLFYFD